MEKTVRLKYIQPEFQKQLKKYCNINDVHNYYGMVEQTGSIFLECKNGNFHTSIFNDILIRNQYDFSLSKIGNEGIVQVFSLIPKSYPGHSILTEDKGLIIERVIADAEIKKNILRLLAEYKILRSEDVVMFINNLKKKYHSKLIQNFSN